MLRAVPAQSSPRAAAAMREHELEQARRREASRDPSRWRLADAAADEAMVEQAAVERDAHVMAQQSPADALEVVVDEEAERRRVSLARARMRARAERAARQNDKSGSTQ